MRIGIIGGGAAGLTTAWLLDGDHDVTVFERDDRLGGHAHTIDIEAHGRRLAVDAGFQFFGAGSAYAMFNRLLDVLEVERRTYSASITVFDDERRRPPVAMPPVRGARPVWSSLTPSGIRTLLRFRRFLSALPAFLRQGDRSLTIAEYLERARLPRTFVEEFLLPLLLSFWCVDRADFERFAAYNALYYLGVNAPRGLSAPGQTEIPGGMKTYVDALIGGLQHATVKTGTAAVRVSLDGDGFVITDAEGTRHPFDRVVVAANARQALGLIESMPELAAVSDQLRRFEYFDTKIAIHGDRRLMPADESAWSVVNVRWDGSHSSLSIWDPAAGLPVFKSWVTFDEQLPDPLYAVATYEHGKISPEYFDAQERLKALNGTAGLWLAGLYTDDADSHESAIRSAVTVARALAPDSDRLRRLLA